MKPQTLYAMQRHYSYIIVGLYFLAFFVSCKESVVINCHNPDFIRDIPIERKGRLKGQVDYFYPIYIQMANKLGLDFLQDGYDSLQIRVWLGHSMAKISHIVIIKYNPSGYSGELWEYENVLYEIDIDGEKRFKDSIRVVYTRKVAPISGWPLFFKKVSDLDIINLRHCRDIAGYSGLGADGIGYYFEVATRKSYRFFSYDNPEEQTARFVEAQKVMEFTDFLEEEFKFEYTR